VNSLFDSIAARAAAIPNHQFLGNSAKDWALASTILVVAWATSLLVRHKLAKSLKRLSVRTKSSLDDEFAKLDYGPLGGLLLLLGAYFAASILELSVELQAGLDRCLLVAAGFLGILLALRLVDAVFEGILKPWARRSQSEIDDLLALYGKKVAKVLVTLLIGVTVLEQVGFDVVSILTGMGIGGLAVALAAQETLGNVLGSVQILTDHPFGVGDWVSVDGQMGEVAEIGLRSTKLKTYNGILVVIPNRHIAEVTIHNLTADGRLAIVLELGLVYGTSSARIEEAKALLRQILDSEDSVCSAPMIHFLRFDDSALGIRCTYFIEDYSQCWSTQDAVNLAVKSAFDAAGLDFAFPTQTLHIVGNAGA
jgi:MscS family membrane protein